MTTSTNNSGSPKPTPALEGIRVLSLECYLAGPTASMWLADMGAEVIKVEQPGTGDPARSLTPHKEGGERRSLALLRANRNKKSLTLDLKMDEGKAVFERLLARTDVLIDNLRPDALERLGFSWPRMQKVNPRLIYTSISGFGRNDMSEGPYQGWPAFDIVGQAMAGLMKRPERETDAPSYLGFPLTDIQVGIIAVTGTLQALFHRTRTGVGQRVDAAMYDAALVMNELAVILYTSLGVIPGPGLHALSYPFGSFKARDGFVVIGVLGEKIWERFCHAIGQPELGRDPRLQSGVARNEHAHWLNKVINEWLAGHDRDAAVAHLVANGIPAAPVQDVDDIVNCPQVAARNMLMEIDDPAWGKTRVLGQPVKTSGSPPPRCDRPPFLGEHTEQLLHDLLDLSDAEMQQLRSTGVI